MTDNVIAIVPAAGMGKRFGAGTNKPFEMLAGRPLLIRTLQSLDAIHQIKEIIPVIKEADMGFTVQLFEEYAIPKVRRVAPGGKERQDSVSHGLKLIDNKDCTVLIHDGVRPLVEPSFVSDALSALKDCDGVAAGVPVKDTIKEISDFIVTKTLRREKIWAIQTPQVFRYHTIVNAYEKAVDEGWYATDDSALVEHYGGKIRVIMGSYKNIKVTTPEDLEVAELFLKMKGGLS